MAAKEMPVLPLVASMIDRPGLEGAPLVAAAEDVKGHPVLDAAGHVEVLGLGVDDAPLAVEAQIDGQEGRVARPVSKSVQARFEDVFGFMAP